MRHGCLDFTLDLTNYSLQEDATVILIHLSQPNYVLLYNLLTIHYLFIKIHSE